MTGWTRFRIVVRAMIVPVCMLNIFHDLGLAPAWVLLFDLFALFFFVFLNLFFLVRGEIWP